MCEQWILCPYTGEHCGDCDKRECLERAFDDESQAEPTLIAEDDLDECFETFEGAAP